MIVKLPKMLSAGSIRKQTLGLDVKLFLICYVDNVRTQEINKLTEILLLFIRRNHYLKLSILELYIFLLCLFIVDIVF